MSERFDFHSAVLLKIQNFLNVILFHSAYTRSVRKVSSHFEYLENRLRGLDVTWQPVRGDLTVHL